MTNKDIFTNKDEALCAKLVLIGIPKEQAELVVEYMKSVDNSKKQTKGC